MKRSEIVEAYGQMVDEFSRRLPDHHQIFALGQLYREARNLEIATGYLAMATSMQPEEPSYFQALGEVLLEQDKTDYALISLQTCIALGGGDATVFSARDRCVEELGDKMEGIHVEKLRWATTKYFFTREGNNATNDGSLALWIGPFAGEAGTVPSNLINSFKEFLDADVIVMNVRQFSYILGIYPDDFLRCLAVDLRPDVIFYFSPSLSRSTKNPRLETINWMRHLTGAALVTICLDLAKPYYQNTIKLLAGACDLVVTTDVPADDELRHLARDRVMMGWHVVDTSAFEPIGQTRDIDISFIGKYDGHYQYREPYLKHLTDNDVDLYLAGSTAGRFLSNDEYADVMRRSKLALNFSGFELASTWDFHPLTLRDHLDSGECHHLKARVFEVMESEALLLESENSVITQWFEPFVHYVPFSDRADLLEKTRYYLEHEEERRAIAEAGRRKVRESYGAENFWRGIFDPLYKDGRFKKLPTWQAPPNAQSPTP
jgi:hypothetical protein